MVVVVVFVVVFFLVTLLLLLLLFFFFFFFAVFLLLFLQVVYFFLLPRKRLTFSPSPISSFAPLPHPNRYPRRCSVSDHAEAVFQSLRVASESQSILARLFLAAHRKRKQRLPRPPQRRRRRKSPWQRESSPWQRIAVEQLDVNDVYRLDDAVADDFRSERR